MTDLRAADAWARERALDVGRSFIVQAPAGAGKTELLTRRFLALLATVAEPESILAITFTRKAAAEMRDRILGALRAVHAPDPARPLQERTLQLARAALAADAKHGWNLLAQPGRLRIQTIDALNLGLARRLPLLSGLGAGLGIEEDARELYRIAAERLLEQLPHGAPSDSAAVATLLAHVDNRVGPFVELVIEMLMRREAWLPVLPDDVRSDAEQARLREHLESARQRLVGSHLESLQRAIPQPLLRDAAEIAAAAARNLTAAGAASAICAWHDATQRAEGSHASAAQWQGLAQLLLTADGKVRSAFDKRVGIPPGKVGQDLKRRAGLVAAALGEHAEAVALLHAVRDLPSPEYDADEWRVLLAQFRVLRLAVAELELVFAERRVADYPRFAWAARQSLGSADAPTDTALALDARLAHVLVDEFQDTSEAQVRLLEALTAGWQRDDGRTLFLVGDPMQSIYRFRNAEVGLFLDIRDRGLGDLELEPLTLAVNFRSTVPVVDWINDCFAQVLPEADDLLRGAVSYAPSVARPEAGGEGGVKVHALLRRSRLYEAEQVAAIVRERLASDPDARDRHSRAGPQSPRAHRRRACRTGHRVPRHRHRSARRAARRARPALAHARAGASRRSPGLARGAARAVVRADARGAVHAVRRRSRSDDRRAVARSSTSRTPRWRVAPETGACMARARDGPRPSCGISVCATRSSAPGTHSADRRPWRSARGLDEAEAYLETLADLEARQAGPVDLERLGRALEKLYAPSRERADVRVELLTVHKAKGLQYDTVIVPALERLPGRDPRRLLHWLKLPLAGRDELIVAPVARTGAEPNLLYRWLEALEHEKLLQERRRLLYVAATRAERWLHLFGSAQVQEQDDPPVVRRPAANSALGLLWPAVGHEFVERLAALGAVESEQAPESTREPPLRRLPADWEVGGCAARAANRVAGAAARRSDADGRVRLGDGDGAPRGYRGASRTATHRPRPRAVGSRGSASSPALGARAGGTRRPAGAARCVAGTRRERDRARAGARARPVAARREPSRLGHRARTHRSGRGRTRACGDRPDLRGCRRACAGSSTTRPVATRARDSRNSSIASRSATGRNSSATLR